MNKVPDSVRKELAALAAKPEGEIDFSDLPATQRKDWQGTERGKFYRPIKQKLTVRIHADVLEWLKSQGIVRRISQPLCGAGRVLQYLIVTIWSSQSARRFISSQNDKRTYRPVPGARG